MRRADNKHPSTFGREVTIRLTRRVANVLAEHLRHDPNKEQMAFALGHQASTAEGTLLLFDELVLPEADDLLEQSLVAVCPTKECQSYVYFQAQQGKNHSGIPHPSRRWSPPVQWCR